MIEQIMDINGRATALEDALRNILRVGTVVNRDPANYRCRVEFKDNDGLVSYWCQVITLRAFRDKLYWMPEVGEMAICLFLPFGHEQGFIVGSAYNVQDKRPLEAEDEDLYIENDDRIVIKANKDLHIKSLQQIYIKAMDTITIESPKLITLRAPRVIIDGELHVNGRIFDIRGNLTDHTNRGYERD